MGHEASGGLRWDDKWTSGWSTMGAEGRMGGAPGSERCGYGEPRRSTGGDDEGPGAAADALMGSVKGSYR